jgi:hypothetical protein
MKFRKMKLKTAWLLTTLFSVVVGTIFYVGGKLGDCGPKDIDGQCGMSSFVGLTFGILAGATIFIVMTFYFVIVARERKG